MNKLYIEVIDERVRDYYKNWNMHHKGDSGVDLTFPEMSDIYIGDTKLIPLGIKIMATDLNNNQISTLLYPRSSIYKTPLMLVNSVGIIDAGYRGEIHVPIYHRLMRNLLLLFMGLFMGLYVLLNWWLYILPICGVIMYFYNNNIIAYYNKNKGIFMEKWGLRYTCNPNKSLFQLCSPNMGSFEIIIIDKLPDSERGIGGFGSTDKKIK